MKDYLGRTGYGRRKLRKIGKMKVIQIQLIFTEFAKIRHTTKAISSLQVRDTLITDNKDIMDHITSYFENLFNSNEGIVQDLRFVDEVISNLVDEGSNVMVIMLPSSLEIKNVVFALNKDGAPDSNGFGAFFFQTFWDIIHKDVE